MNFSYPSLEEPKPPTPPPPEPEVPPEPQEPSVPVVNGLTTSETPSSTYRLPDAVDSPITGSTNTRLDINNKAPAASASSQSPATAKAFPQVLYLLWQLIITKHLGKQVWLNVTHVFFCPLIFLSQFDRTKKPSVWVSDEPKPSQNGSAKDSTQNGPVIPDRSVKPTFVPNTPLSKEEQSQIHSEAVAVMEKARQEQEKRNQERRLEEEAREKERKEKELKEKLEKEEHDKTKKEEEEKGHQEKKKLERQKAEEEEDKENRVWEEKERKGKEQSSDTPSKSMSLDSPAPNHIVSEIKVSPLFCRI